MSVTAMNSYIFQVAVWTSFHSLLSWHAYMVPFSRSCFILEIQCLLISYALGNAGSSRHSSLQTIISPELRTAEDPGSIMGEKEQSNTLPNPTFKIMFWLSIWKNSQPASHPACLPTNQLTSYPARQPGNQPVSQTTSQPANQPTNQTTN